MAETKAKNPFSLMEQCVEFLTLRDVKHETRSLTKRILMFAAVSRTLVRWQLACKYLLDDPIRLTTLKEIFGMPCRGVVTEKIEDLSFSFNFLASSSYLLSSSTCQDTILVIHVQNHI